MAPVQQQIPCGLIRTVAFDCVGGDVFAEPKKAFGEHLGVDDCVCIDSLGMNRCGILALLDVDPALVERYRVNLAEFFTATTAQIFIAAQLGLLWRKAVTVDRCSLCTTRCANEIGV